MDSTDLEKELRVEVSDMREIGRGPTLAVPPTPPAKDLPQPPARLRLEPPSPISSPYEPPNRPLPARPTATSQSPKIPQPSRPPPSRAQAPLAMNPPTRPGTALSQTSGVTVSVRFPVSTKRLSWASDASKRPIKYGQGKFGRVELVPQPSDDLDDPLVWPQHQLLSRVDTDD